MRYEPDEAEGGAADPVTGREQGEFYIAAWRRAFHLFGAASRTEFWSFALINLAVFVVLFVVSWRSVPEPGSGDTNYLALLLFAFMLVVPVPTLTVAIRRIRDVTGNGWFALLLLLTFTPFVGSVIGTLAGRSFRGVEESSRSMSYGGVWRSTHDWGGRSTRSEFWSFVLINMLLFLGVLVVLFVALAATGFPPTPFRTWGYVGFAEITLVTVVVLSAPTLPLLVRRVRDATGSGWVSLVLILISLVNPLLYLVVMLSPTRDAERLTRLSTGYWDVWRKTADWVGVAKRSEFWPFTLIHFAVSIAELAFAAALYSALSDRYGNLGSDEEGVFYVTVFLMYLSHFVLYIPWFSLAVRRVRDGTGSGWWLMTWFIPLIGFFVVLVLFLLPTHDAMSSSLSEPSEEPTSPPDEDTQYDPEDPWQRQQPGPTASNTDQR